MSSPLLSVGMHGFRLHCINDEAELVAQRLVSVGHADLGDVCLMDIVSFRSIFQIVLSQEALFILVKFIRMRRGKNDSIFM